MGSNSVPVLATLFLLSYAKLLRTVILAVAFTFITFKDVVWLQDGNVRYFSPKHIPLFLTALIFLFLFILPLTLLVLLAPCLQARSHHKAFRWVNRLKPFLDAYQGPYSDKFRFWTGLLLILRIVLFIMDAANYKNDKPISFFWTTATVGPIAIFCLSKRNIYRSKFANFLETLSLLNTSTLFAVSWLTTSTGYDGWYILREYATYISVAVTMISFIIVMLHRLHQSVENKVKRRFRQKKRNKRRRHSSLTDTEPVVSAPTSTMVELDNCTGSQLKEPLLDSN